jgi:ketosteroid isomerase-like protein
MAKTNDLKAVADAFITATNAYDADAVVALFTEDAVIDDPSTGHKFDGHAGIRDYVERYFKGYHTVTRLMSIESISDRRTRVRVNFTGDFGYEIGRLDITINKSRLITRIDADLE